jgi:hypothetical protein
MMSESNQSTESLLEELEALRRENAELKVNKLVLDPLTRVMSYISGAHEPLFVLGK